MAKFQVGQIVICVEGNTVPLAPNHSFAVGEKLIITETGNNRNSQFVALARADGTPVGGHCGWDEKRFRPYGKAPSFHAPMSYDAAYYEAITNG